METSALDEAVTIAREIAKEASALLLSGFRSFPAVRKKGAIDLVTDFDLRCEALVKARLAAAFPSHRVVGEETSTAGDSLQTKEDDKVWYVDPLDGTTNFAHGHPVFSVSLGLMRGPEPLLGVVAAPALDVIWWGARGLGAFRNGVPCRVSATDQLEDALVATGFPVDRSRKDDNIAEARAFLKQTRGFRRCGSAAVDLAMVADGTYDAYWESHLNAWDLSGGALLVLEAGGQLSDFNGSPADVRSGRVFASNGHLHGAGVSILASR